MPFDAPYVFGMNNHIVLKHAGGKFLRVTPNNLTQVDPNGGKGPFAQWNVEKHNNQFKFKSTKTGKYLRIQQNGVIDCAGTGGPWTLFNAHGSGNSRKLESVKVPGKYIAVRNGQVVFGTGGPFCVITFWRNGQQQQHQQQHHQHQQHHQQQQKQPFSQGYMFSFNNHIVIQHAGGKFLRVSPNNMVQVDAHGGKGPFAQWLVEKHNDLFKFKNFKSGKYLRIQQNGVIDCGGTGGPWTLFKAHGSGNKRKLESTKVPGKYIAVRNNQVVFGTGGPFCFVTCFRKQ